MERVPDSMSANAYHFRRLSADSNWSWHPMSQTPVTFDLWPERGRGKAARRDLCGGLSAITAPTATRIGFGLD